MSQDVIADDAALNQAFSRQGQSDWMRSLKVLARAQAMCWHALPIKDRRMWLALAQAEDEKVAEMRVLVHGQ